MTWLIETSTQLLKVLIVKQDSSFFSQYDSIFFAILFFRDLQESSS
jgi:hypothetical protein